MSNEMEMLVQKSSAHIISAANPSRFVARSAHFLLPRADTTRLPALPFPVGHGGPVLADELQMEFRGWPGSPNRWRRWVAKIRPRHELLWRRVGIFDAILATTRRVRRDEDLLLQLSAFWSRDTSTFVFPWGEATVTLEDVAVLGGLPMLGFPAACPVLPDDLRGDMDALEAVRSALNRSKSKKPNYSSWVKYFLERPPEEDAAGEGGVLLEHGAFLAMWLSAFVLPSPPFGVVQARVFPIAVRLARDKRVALAPSALASIYSSLSSPVGCAPLQILQLWVWERFRELRPETGRSPGLNGDGVLERAARWHNVRTTFDPRYIHAVFMSPKKFEWMPYGGRSFGLPPGNGGGRRVHGQEIAGSEELLSMALGLRPCELEGLNSIEQYCPHRVARQLGFDQDVPGNVPRVNSDPEAAWATYKVEPSALAFIVPHGDPGVTLEYERWWQPHSSACAADVAKAAKRKRHSMSFHQRKRKTKGTADADAAAAPVESLNGEATAVDMQSTPEDIVVISDDESDEESGKESAAVDRKSTKLVTEENQLVISSTRENLQGIRLPMETSGQGDDGCELLAVARNNSASREEPVDGIPPAENLNGEAIAVDLQSTPEGIVVISDDESDKESEKGFEVAAMDQKSTKLVTSASDRGKPNKEPIDDGCELLAAARNSGSRKEPVDMSPSNPVNGNTEPVERVVCTRTLYYLTPFERKKDGEMSARGTHLDQGFFQPRREVGTSEMIMQASEAREDEKAELQKRIDSLKKQIWG